MRLKTILLSLGFLCLLSDCTEPFDFETNRTDVVVNCILTYPSETQSLTLSYSVANGKTDAQAINDATISLYDHSTDEVAGVFYSAGNGEYLAPISINPGHTYSLEVDVKGEKHISATTEVPEATIMTYIPNPTYSWTHNKTMGTCASSTQYDLSAFNNSIWMYILNYDSSSDTYKIADHIATSSDLVDQFNRSGRSVLTEFDSDDWRVSAFQRNGAYYDKYLHFEPHEEGTSVTTLLCGNMESPFYSSPASETPEWHASPNKMPLENMGYIVLLSVSDDYDKYFKDVISRRMNEGCDDFSTIYEKEHTYTNINEGIGIFGAELTYYLSWDKSYIFSH